MKNAETKKFRITVFSRTENNHQVFDLIPDDDFIVTKFIDHNTRLKLDPDHVESNLIVFNLVAEKVSSVEWRGLLNNVRDTLNIPIFVLVNNDDDIAELEEWKGGKKIIDTFTQYDRKPDFDSLFNSLVFRLKTFILLDKEKYYFDFDREVPKYGPTV